MTDSIMRNLKAWTALIVVIITALSQVIDLPIWVTAILAVASALAVYQVPNATGYTMPPITEAGYTGNASQDS